VQTRGEPREPQQFWILADDIKPPTLVRGDEELMRGVRLIHMPGQTSRAGPMVLHVELDHTRSVLFACDALYTQESYGPPPAGTPMNPDSLGWAASVEKLRRIARQHEALVLPSHSETGIRQHGNRAAFTPAPTTGAGLRVVTCQLK
jgi:glyoxylase-like metal-dependent hydrolase (beta-lactamase superfamily II)